MLQRAAVALSALTSSDKLPLEDQLDVAKRQFKAQMELNEVRALDLKPLYDLTSTIKMFERHAEQSRKLQFFGLGSQYRVCTWSPGIGEVSRGAQST